MVIWSPLCKATLVLKTISIPPSPHCTLQFGVQLWLTIDIAGRRQRPRPRLKVLAFSLPASRATWWTPTPVILDTQCNPSETSTSSPWSRENLGSLQRVARKAGSQEQSLGRGSGRVWTSLHSSSEWQAARQAWLQKARWHWQ